MGALGGDRVDHQVGDLVERLFPRDALPLARAALADALERVLHPRRIVHAGAVTPALLAAARVEVRRVGADSRIVRRLLLAPDDPVLYVHVPGAVRLVPAVHEVRAADALVPPPLVAEHILPSAIRRDRRCRPL